MTVRKKNRDVVEGETFVYDEAYGLTKIMSLGNLTAVTLYKSYMANGSSPKESVYLTMVALGYNK